MGRTYLFVINSFLAGGAERSLVEGLPRLVDRGVTPVIACLRYRDVGFEEEVRAAGYDVRLLDGESRLTKIRSLRTLIRELQPALVYTSLFDADLAGRIAALGMDVPVITNLANTAYDEARLDDPNLSPGRVKAVKLVDGFTSRHMTDHFHAVSQAVKDSTVTHLGVDPDRITVVKRGRDRDRLGEPSPERRRTVRERLGVAQDAEVVVTVGRQEYQKAHTHLIEAFALVAANRPDARLLIAGREGHATAEIDALIERLGVGDIVTMLGHRDDVPDVMAASDLFVFPSLYEGLGGALIEAIGLGLPVVASDIPALREVVVEGENALLFPPGDVASLATAIGALLDDPERRTAFGQRSRELFDAEFRAEDAIERLLDFLDEVAGVAPPVIDDQTATSLIGGMRDRRKAVADGVSWSVQSEWRSFKADFVEVHSNDHKRVALKLGDDWTSADAQYVAEEVERVRRLFKELPSGRVRVPRALGWSEEPAAVAMRYFEGENLFHIIGDVTHPMWQPDGDTLLAMVGQCGEALGAYHTAQPAEADDPVTTRIAMDDLLSAARRAGVRTETIVAVEPDLPRARGYRFSPNDFAIDVDQQLVMLDPPHVRKFDYLHRDVSAFTFELHRATVGDRPDKSDAVRSVVYDDLRSAFLTGYARTGPSDLSRPIDDWAIRMFEISRITGLAYARIRRRRPHAAVTPLRWALEARRQLGSPPSG